MHHLRQFALLLLFATFIFSCTPTNDQEDDAAPDYSNQITGTYAFTTYEGSASTGSGTAIITKESNTRIRIGLEDGVSFTATNLQRVDDDMVMDVPNQEVNYYGMDATFIGARTISRESSMYQGVYFGKTGELRIGLQISVGTQTDPVLLVLER